MYQAFDFHDYTPTLGDLESAGVQIFNDWWNTYIPEYKPVLMRKILHTYHFNQIGSETPDRFVYNLNAQLERIMPYYNQLYQSELIKFNPLLNHSIESNGRTIENLLSKANTSDDKAAKVIRDFAGVTDKSATGDSNTTGNINKVSDGIDKTGYSKTGSEHVDDFNNMNRTDDETEKLNRDVTAHADEHTDDITNTTGSKDVTGKETETPNETSVKKTEWGQTDTGTKNITGNIKSDGSGTKNWTETRDDDSTTDTTTKLTESSSASGEKDYSDTPQMKLDVNPEDGTSNVRKDYLTNITWTDESSKHTADTTQKQTFADDETKKHDETTTDKNTTDSTENTSTSNAKGGTDTETTTHTGTNVTDKTSNENTTENADRDVTTTKDSTENTTQTTTTNDVVHETNDRDIDKNWKEGGEETTTKHNTDDTTSKGTSHETTSGTEQTKENVDINSSSTGNTVKEKEETTDKGNTTITSGYMNVSASALLEAFRRTFLNIDDMIIKELRDNFMLVY